MTDTPQPRSENASVERRPMVAVQPRKPWSELTDEDANEIVEAMFRGLTGKASGSRHV